KDGNDVWRRAVLDPTCAHKQRSTDGRVSTEHDVGRQGGGGITRLEATQECARSVGVLRRHSTRTQPAQKKTRTRASRVLTPTALVSKTHIEIAANRRQEWKRHTGDGAIGANLCHTERPTELQQHKARESFTATLTLPSPVRVLTRLSAHSAACSRTRP